MRCCWSTLNARREFVAGSLGGIVWVEKGKKNPAKGKPQGLEKNGPHDSCIMKKGENFPAKEGERVGLNLTLRQSGRARQIPLKQDAQDARRVRFVSEKKKKNGSESSEPRRSP